MSWLKISRIGAAARRMTSSSVLSAKRRLSVSGRAFAMTSVLDVLDRVAQQVQEREVAVDDRVDQRPEEVIGTARQHGRESAAQGRHRARVPPRPVDGQQEPLAEDDVDLGALGVIVVLEREDHDVDELVGDLDLRPLVALEDVLGDERVEADHLGDRRDLVRRRPR